MAVQSQYPANVVLPDGSNRSGAAGGNEDHRTFLAAGLNQSSYFGKFQNPSPVVTGSNRYRLFNQLVGGRQGYTLQLDSSLNGGDKEIAAVPLSNSRKRAREGDDLRSQWQQQCPQTLNVSDFPQTGPGSVVNPQSTGVSTGLRLTFEDDRLRSTSPVSTSGRVEVTKNFASNMPDGLAAPLQQDRDDEIEQLLKIQNDQLKSFFEEKRQRYSRHLVATMEEGFASRLREKDAEMDKVKRHNQDLMKRYTQFNAELHHWQTKAREMESMVSILRSNLQHAQQQAQFPLSLNQSKEGCGDSEADDCASSYVDNINDAHTRTFNENKELREQRTCRVCRCNDVSMLLLPCRHLCLCQDCEGQLHACPLCRTPKNASVQVFMS